MSDTVKHATFCREPMGSKPVSEIPGIGPAMMKKLNDMGIYEARDIYEVLRKQNFDLAKFRTWMQQNCRGGRYQSCYNALLDWHNEFDNGNINTNFRTKTQREPKRTVTPRATKNNNVQKPRTSVTFDQTNQKKVTNNAERFSQKRFLEDLETDETALFFMSMQMAVKKFDPDICLEVKSEIYKIVSEYQRRHLVRKRPEPVASTSTSARAPCETFV